MPKILSSATRIVLLSFSAAAILGLFLNKISSDQFMALAGVVFGAFFAMKGAAPAGGDGK